MIKEKTLAKFKMAQLVKLVIHEVTRSHTSLLKLMIWGRFVCLEAKLNLFGYRGLISIFL